MKLYLYILVFFSATPAFAFVENVTHGYPNCMACHVSPSGGGVLNDYGRSLSKDLMSTWSWKGAEEPIFGLVKNSEIIKWGGDVRYIQTYFENSDIKEGKEFLMQANIEAAVTIKKLTLVATAGTLEGPQGTPKKGQFISERHFVLWEVSDTSFLRIGKYRLNFGLNDPNHTRLTKSPLGFGSFSETYNMEFSQFSEFDEIFISTSLGRIDEPRNTQIEKSITATYANYISEKSKLGVSALIGESDSTRRSLLGVFSVFPITDNSLAKVEIDFQRSHFVSDPTQPVDLLTGSTIVGYNLYKGIFPYLVYERLHQDLRDNKTVRFQYGLGIQWLPIPHIELQAEYKKLEIASASDPTADSAWIIFHYYL